MKAWDILGWTYDADVHCEDCAESRFGSAIHDEQNPPVDSEGNEVHPMFASDEHSEDGSPVHCGDCGDEIVEESYEHKNAREQAAELQESAIMIDGTPAFFSLAIKLKDTPRMWGASARHVLAQVLRDLANKAETDGINLETGNLWVDGQIVGQSALIEF